MRRTTLLLSLVALVGTLIAIGLPGCDRAFSLGDPISPTADIRVTSLNLPTGALLTPFIGAVAGTQSSGTTTPVTEVDYPTVNMQLTIFNGVSVQLTSFNVSYFHDDGVTPLGLPPFKGVLQVFLDGGTLSEFNPSDISPGSKINTAPKAGGGTVQIQIVDNDLKSFMAGPDQRFRLGTSDTKDVDDFTGLIVAVATINGTDINRHDISIVAKISVTAQIPVEPISGASGGGSTGGTTTGGTTTGGLTAPQRAPSSRQSHTSAP